MNHLQTTNFKTMKRVLFLFLGILCLADNLFGQNDAMNCCSMNNMDMNSVLEGPQHKAGMLMFTYSFMNSLMQNNYSGTNKVNDQFIFNRYLMSPENMQMDMHMLSGMYGVSDRFTIMVMLNYNYMSMNMKMLSGQMNMSGMSSSISMKSTSQGLGDTKISGQYNLISANRQFLSAVFGLSLPTGSIYKTDKENLEFYGDRQVYMMQTGSGTFDLAPGLTYLYRPDKYVLGAQMTTVIHPYYNRQGYKLGNEFSVNSWAAYEWINNTSFSFRLNYNLTSPIKGFDNSISAPLEPAADPKNYGGSFLKGYIGLAHSFQNGFFRNQKVAAEFGIPLYQNFNGIQSATSYNLMISWALNI